MMRCRRYVMTMTREKTVGGIAVTVSMPHRFPYGSILFSVTHAPSLSILSIDRYCCTEFYEAHCVLIARGLVGGSRDIKSNDSPRSRNVDHACLPAILRRLVALFELVLSYSLAMRDTKMCFSRAFIRRD